VKNKAGAAEIFIRWILLRLLNPAGQAGAVGMDRFRRRKDVQALKIGSFRNFFEKVK